MKIRLILFAAIYLSSLSYAWAANKQAKTQRQQLYLGVGINLTMAGIMFAECDSQNYLSCAMGVATLGQAGLQLMAAKDAEDTENDSSCAGFGFCISPDTGGSDGLYTPPDVPGGNNEFGYDNPGTFDTQSGGASYSNPSTPGGAFSGMEGQLKSLGDKYASMGYTYDPSTNKVKTPKGNFDAAQLSTPGGAKALGFSDEQIKDAFEKAQNIAAKANIGDLDSSEGGGGRLPAKGRSGDGFDMKKFMNGMLKQNQRRPAAGNAVAGLQKMMGSQPIGVAGDNIFEMINRRYKNIQTRHGVLP